MFPGAQMFTSAGEHPNLGRLDITKIVVILLLYTHMLHVWYVYLHLGDF